MRAPLVLALLLAGACGAGGPTTLELDDTRVGDVAVGTPAEEARAALDDRLGPPDEDSGWERFPAGDDGRFHASADGLGLSWEHPSWRTVCWDALCVYLGGPSEAAGALTGWALAGDGDGPDAELAGTGIRLGSTWAEVQAAYPGVVAGGGEGASLVVDGRPWDGIFDGAGQWRLSGHWDLERPTHAPPDAVVTRLSGGAGPEAGCC